MKVAVIGSGGREHALCSKISASPKVSKVYAMPGNAGISSCAQCVAIEDISGIAQFCVDKSIDLVFVGPEAPLAKGIVDTLRAKNIKVIGPDMKASLLESSKIWAKEFMNKYNVPTAKYGIVDNKVDLLDIRNSYTYPLVVKMDALCCGKGVFICFNDEDLIKACENIYNDAPKGPKVIVEEFLEGREISFMFFTDGQNYIEMASSKDYKKIFDGDKGPNTGGMGAYSPADIDDKLHKIIIDEVVKPTIEGIKTEKLDYKGLVYAGLMISKEGELRVLEYNVRFGDPETQAIILRMDFDIMDILIPLSQGNLPKNFKAKWKKEEAVCVILAQNGYPTNYKKGVLIDKLKNYRASKNIFLFHSGTSSKEDEEFYTNGGRVLGVCALGINKDQAAKTIYSEIDNIKWEDAVYRTDIAK